MEEDEEVEKKKTEETEDESFSGFAVGRGFEQMS